MERIRVYIELELVADVTSYLPGEAMCLGYHGRCGGLVDTGHPGSGSEMEFDLYLNGKPFDWDCLTDAQREQIYLDVEAGYIQEREYGMVNV